MRWMPKSALARWLLAAGHLVCEVHGNELLVEFIEAVLVVHHQGGAAVGPVDEHRDVGAVPVELAVVPAQQRVPLHRSEERGRQLRDRYPVDE